MGFGKFNYHLKEIKIKKLWGLKLIFWGVNSNFWDIIIKFFFKNIYDMKKLNHKAPSPDKVAPPLVTCIFL